MIALRALVLALLIGTAADAAVLPLKHGTYVVVDTPCDKPAFAAVLTYDGRAFAYPHASDCRSVVRARSGQTFRVSETCSALGDGSKITPTTTNVAYIIQSRTRFALHKEGGSTPTAYRWCATPIARAFR